MIFNTIKTELETVISEVVKKEVEYVKQRIETEKQMLALEYQEASNYIKNCYIAVVTESKFGIQKVMLDKINKFKDLKEELETYFEVKAHTVENFVEKVENIPEVFMLSAKSTLLDEFNKIKSTVKTK